MSRFDLPIMHGQTESANPVIRVFLCMEGREMYDRLKMKEEAGYQGSTAPVGT